MDSDNLFRHSFILSIANIIGMFLAYLFHFYTARTLGPADYGIVGALISLAYIFNVATNTIQTVVMKFTSKFKAEGQTGKINALIRGSIKKLFLPTLLCFFVVVLSSSLISDFLHIPSVVPVIILSFILIFSVLYPIPLAVLNGMEKFKTTGFILVISPILKLLFLILFIYMGYRVNGAMGALVIGMFLTVLISFVPLKGVLREKFQKGVLDKKEIYGYIKPVFFISFCLMFLFTIDVILVKHFFTSEETGYYAAAAMFGKVLYSAACGVSGTLFPKVSKLYTQKKEHYFMLVKTLTYTFAFSALATIGYFLLPGFILELFYGKEYLAASQLLGMFGLAMTFFALVVITVNYKLSLNQTEILPRLVLFAVLEIILICIFHNSLMQVLQIVTLVMGSMFLVTIHTTFKILKTENHVPRST